jgi:aminoglycoside 3-N-acetyltransferase
MATQRPLTRSQLVRDMRALGVRPSVVVMVHASLSRLGWVVGGTETVVRAVLEAASPDGTVCAQAGWEDMPSRTDRWPGSWREAYEREFPAFDPELSSAAHYEGRLAERIRSWPGAARSAHPAMGVTALGARAAWLCGDHPLDDGFGAGTPYARLVEAAGQVLVLGAPLKSISLLHHAEAIAEPSAQIRVRYRLPFRDGHRVTSRELSDIDVWNEPYPYREALGLTEPLATIAGSALRAGVGTAGPVGSGASYLFPARGLVAFAVSWLRRRLPAAAKPASGA